jgi:hypothetical protein
MAFTHTLPRNIISGAIIPTSNAIGLHFYPIWEASTLDEWLFAEFVSPSLIVQIPFESRNTILCPHDREVRG